MSRWWASRVCIALPHTRVINFLVYPSHRCTHTHTHTQGNERIRMRRRERCWTSHCVTAAIFLNSIFPLIGPTVKLLVTRIILYIFILIGKKWKRKVSKDDHISSDQIHSTKNFKLTNVLECAFYWLETYGPDPFKNIFFVRLFFSKWIV